MAITDQTFTSDELTAVIEAKPELLKSISEVLTKKEIFVADKAAKTLYEETLKTQTKSELTGKIAPKVETTVKTISGIEKSAPDEKWYKYNERAMKSLADQKKLLESKVKLFEDKSDISAEERKQLKEYEAKLLESTKSIEDMKIQHAGEISSLNVKTNILAKISKVDATLRKDPLLQEAIGIVRDNVISSMIASAKTDATGKTIFFADGQALKNSDLSFMTEEQVYSKLMDKYIDKTKTTKGAGGTDDVIEDVTPGTIKTQYELSKVLREKGLLAGTPEYTKEFDRLGGSKLPPR